MDKERSSLAVPLSETSQPTNDEGNLHRPREIRRRFFLKSLGVTGAALSASAFLGTKAGAEERSGSLTKGDAAILRFLAAAEIIESDLWLQYHELGGVQDDEVSTLASKLIPGYPAKPTGGNPVYMQDLIPLDADMSQYIHDNTEDELTHEVFINAYLSFQGRGYGQPRSVPYLAQQQGDRRQPVWPPHQPDAAHRRHDLVDSLPQPHQEPRLRRHAAPAIPTLAVGQHTAIPRTDADTADTNFIQAVANTAGFHFAFIEQGGTSLYPKLAQRVTNVEVLRIVLSIGGTEICHFQTWHDKAGNAPHLTNVIDPVTGVSVTFPDLNSPPFGGEDFQTNLIMPEPTVFLSRHFPPVSIIRPTATKGAAMGALKGLTADGLFIGQSAEFFEFLRDLAEDADEARRDG